jgi:hypothetical protein
MGDPAGKKQYWRSGGQIQWIARKRASMKELPDVIQGHDDHHDAPEHVDGFNSVFVNNRHWIGVLFLF